MWTYEVENGELRDPNGAFEGTGYSGLFGVWRNNSATESVHDKGPIPRGLYKIEKPSYRDSALGPCVMRLDPLGFTAFGRTAFRIHGDNARHDASHGCIILGPKIREAVASSVDDILNVV